MCFTDNTGIRSDKNYLKFKSYRFISERHNHEAINKRMPVANSRKWRCKADLRR